MPIFNLEKTSLDVKIYVTSFNNGIEIKKDYVNTISFEFIKIKMLNNRFKFGFIIIISTQKNYALFKWGMKYMS